MLYILQSKSDIALLDKDCEFVGLMKVKFLYNYLLCPILASVYKLGIQYQFATQIRSFVKYVY
jgi:hypothetical protein